MGAFLMIHILRKLPLFESDPDILREIAAEYAEMAAFYEREGKSEQAEMLRVLERVYDPAAPMVERYQLVRALGEGLVDQARIATMRSRGLLARLSDVTATRH